MYKPYKKKGSAMTTQKREGQFARDLARDYRILKGEARTDRLFSLLNRSDGTITREDLMRIAVFVETVWPGRFRVALKPTELTDDHFVKSLNYAIYRFEIPENLAQASALMELIQRCFATKPAETKVCLASCFLASVQRLRFDSLVFLSRVSLESCWLAPQVNDALRGTLGLDASYPQRANPVTLLDDRQEYQAEPLSDDFSDDWNCEDG
jgi:hypothetical protein